MMHKQQMQKEKEDMQKKKDAVRKTLEIQLKERADAKKLEK